MVHEKINWNERYKTGDTPWDSGQVSHELRRVLEEYAILPCRALELGCGTGTNAVFLAEQGFSVTGIDISELAIDRAKALARESNVDARFLQCELEQFPDPETPFRFLFDRGLYHVVRQEQLDRFLKLLEKVTEPGSLWLTLAGNANDPNPQDNGPPTVSAEEMCRELEPLFAIVQMREFQFSGVQIGGEDVRPLAWSVLLRRR